MTNRDAFAIVLALGLALTTPAGAQQPVDLTVRFAQRVEGYLIRVRLTTPVLGPPDRR